MGSKNTRKGKGYLKGLEHFKAVASGNAEGSGSKYARKVVERIKDAHSGGDETVIPASRPSQELKRASGTGYELPSQRDLGPTPRRAPARVEPMDVFAQTRKMATQAYYGAGRTSVKENYDVIRTRNYGEAIFTPIADKDLQSKPCRLVAECIEDGLPFSRWMLSRVVGVSGRQVESVEVQATHHGMFSFLNRWQDERPSRDLASTPLPEGVKAAMVHELDVHALQRIYYAMEQKASEARRPLKEVEDQKIWVEYSGVLKAGKTLTTDAYAGASQQSVRESMDVHFDQDSMNGFFAPPIFSPDFDKEPMPCRLIAECVGDIATRYRWKLSRVSGANGEHVETKEVTSGLTEMARFLMNWNKRANQDFVLAEAALPDGVVAVPVSRLNQEFLMRILTEAREERLQEGARYGGKPELRF